jgi:hypothetical protein
LCGCPTPIVPSQATVKASDLPGDAAELNKIADAFEMKGDPVSLENALVAREKILQLDPHSYESLWKLARVAGELSDAARADTERDRRTHFAAAARSWADTAIAIDPNAAPAHFYKAEALGLYASTHTIRAIELLPKMVDQLKLAIKADEKFDHGGPHRLLGALLTKAPGWPRSVGDVDEGLSETKRAVELDGDYPENRLYYGEALIANDKKDDGRAELEKVLAAPGGIVSPPRMARWKSDAQMVLEKLKSKK